VADNGEITMNDIRKISEREQQRRRTRQSRSLASLRPNMILKAALRDGKPLCDAPSPGIFTSKVAIILQLLGKGCDCSCVIRGRRDWYGL
jgi:hypothetical protein